MLNILSYNSVVLASFPSNITYIFRIESYYQQQAKWLEMKSFEQSGKMLKKHEIVTKMLHRLHIPHEIHKCT